MNHRPIPTLQALAYLLLLAVWALVIGAGIYHVAHTSQPQYSDPFYGILESI